MTDAPTKPSPAAPATLTPAPARATRPESKPRTKQPWLWNVVLLNDEHHTYEYVIKMVQQLFGHPLEKAFSLAVRVDEDGRAVCVTTHKELAELKRDQILAFGRDPIMRECKGSMSAVIEPAECGGADDDVTK